MKARASAGFDLMRAGHEAPAGSAAAPSGPSSLLFLDPSHLTAPAACLQPEASQPHRSTSMQAAALTVLRWAAGTAGAAAGLSLGATLVFAQAAWQLLGSLALLPRRLPSLIGPPARPIHTKPLLNLVVVGDSSSGAPAALAYAFAGRQPPPRPSTEADFLFCDVPDASCSIWLPHNELLDLGPHFFSLADAFMLVYEPHSQPHPASQLDFWAGVCAPGCSEVNHCASSSPPIVVVAANWGSFKECQEGASAEQQAAAVAEGERWCAEHGGVLHCLVRRPQDIQAALERLLHVGLACHSPHRSQAEPGPEAALAGMAAGAAGPRQEAAQLCSHQVREAVATPRGPQGGSLPLLMQSELGPALQRLTPSKAHCLATS